MKKLVTLALLGLITLAPITGCAVEEPSEPDGEEFSASTPSEAYETTDDEEGALQPDSGE